MHHCLNVAVALSYQHSRLFCAKTSLWGKGFIIIYWQCAKSYNTFPFTNVFMLFYVLLTIPLYLWPQGCGLSLPVKISFHLKNLPYILSNLSKKLFPSFSLYCLCFWLKSIGNNWYEHQYWQNAELFMWHV